MRNLLRRPVGRVLFMLCFSSAALAEEAQSSARAACAVAGRAVMTQIDINAAPKQVWAVLVDFPSAPSWNPFIRSISGAPERGERLKVEIAPPGRSEMRFEPLVLEAKPAVELRWRGSFLTETVFAGEHAFCLEQTSAKTTRFTQSEIFSGLIAPFIMDEAGLETTRAGFEAMNEALKRRAEQR